MPVVRDLPHGRRRGVAMSKEGSTDSSLLARATPHDPDAWKKLVAWSGPLVFFWCRKAGLNKEDREDVFQDVFLKVHRRLEEFDHDGLGATFRGWLLIITRNALVDLARRRLNVPKPLGGAAAYKALATRAEEVLPDSEANHAEARKQALSRAVMQLRGEFSEVTWKAFWRTAVDGLTSPEVAAELSLSADAVRKARSRVLARLRSEFGDLME